MLNPVIMSFFQDLRDHLFSSSHIQKLKKMYNLGSESGLGSPLGFDIGSSGRHVHHSLQSLSQVHTSPSTLSPLGNTPDSRLNLPDIHSPGGAMATPPNFTPLFNNLNLKNLNANIQRIIAAKNVLGTGLLNITPPNQSSVPGSQSDNGTGGPSTVITEVP